MERFQDLVVRLTRAVATAAVLAMMAVTVASVVGRLRRTPLFGAEELVAWLGLLALAASLPYCHVHRAHIGVELIVRRLSPRWQWRMKLLRDLLSLGLFGLMTWAVAAYAQAKLQSGDLSLNLGWPEGLVVAALAVGLGLTAAVMAAELTSWLRRRP